MQRSEVKFSGAEPSKALQSTVLLAIIFQRSKAEPSIAKPSEA